MHDRPDTVNVFPPDLSIGRLEELAAEFRQRLLYPELGGPPDWYVRAILDLIEGRLNGRPCAT
jgi:hypothetical protein